MSTKEHARAIRRWRRHLANEYAEARIYRDLATRRTGEEREILLGLADAEERHASHWLGLLGADVAPLAGVARGCGCSGSSFAGSLPCSYWRWRSVPRCGRRMTAIPTLPPRWRPTNASMPRLCAVWPPGDVPGFRGRPRAAVFGANDGLVSNLALILGVVGGGAASSTVLLTGLAGLLAGALSMAAGEYISVRSQRELLAASTPDAGTHKVLHRLDVDANELALVYRARGMSETEAKKRADAVLRDVHAGASATRAEEDQHEIVGTAVGAAVSSFAFFASGAAVPVLPFLFGLAGRAALVTAVVLVSLALMLTGATVGVLAGGPPLRRALRQLAIGIGAAACTYLLGLLFGATLG